MKPTAQSGWEKRLLRLLLASRLPYALPAKLAASVRFGKGLRLLIFLLFLFTLFLIMKISGTKAGTTPNSTRAEKETKIEANTGMCICGE